MKWRGFLFAPEGDGTGGGGGAPSPAAGAAPAAATAGGGQSLLGGSDNAGAAPTGAGAAPAQTWINPDGTFNHDFAPQEYKGNPSLSIIKDVPSLAKSFVETKAFVGQRFTPPTAGSTPAQWSEFRKLVGAPDTADGYEITKPEGLPDDVAAGLLGDEGLGKKITAIFHKHGVPAAAWKEVYGAFTGHMVDGVKQQAAQAETQSAEFFNGQRAELEKAWGADFDKHSGTVRKVAAMAGLPADPLEWTPAAMSKALHSLSGMFNESRIAGATGGTLAAGSSKAQAQAIIGDKASPYWQPDHPQHAATVALVNNLMKGG